MQLTHPRANYTNSSVTPQPIPRLLLTLAARLRISIRESLSRLATHTQAKLVAPADAQATMRPCHCSSHSIHCASTTRATPEMNQVHRPDGTPPQAHTLAPQYDDGFTTCYCACNATATLSVNKRPTKPQRLFERKGSTKHALLQSCFAS